MKKYNVAVIYGGTNTEHEISIITALQAMNALVEAGHTVVPVYISKSGTWHTGSSDLLESTSYQNLNQLTQILKPTQLKHLKSSHTLTTINRLGQEKTLQSIDVAFPIFHGAYGEDGSIHGLLKMLNLPVMGSTLMSAAIGMDKFVSKKVAFSLGIPVLQDVLLTRTKWRDNPELVLTQIQDSLGAKVIIKPCGLGSSIGIHLAKNIPELHSALEIAFTLDTRVLVETLLDNPTEIQISLMGNDPYEFSVTEQPLKSQELLSFEDKYIENNKQTSSAKGMASASRLIPAPIKPDQTKTIREYAENFYRAIGGQGLARVDFLLHEQTIYFNEINTIPGSLSFYLWEKSGYPFPQLVNELIRLALLAHEETQNLVKTFETNILANIKLGKAKT